MSFLTSAQIISQACLTAKVPKYTTNAGQLLNMILGDLCNYDLDVNRGLFTFTFNGSTSGPYPLAPDWLRANVSDVFYTILGVAYIMVPISMAEFDALVQQAGLNSYPGYYAVDNSPISTGKPPNMYVWPPPSGAFPVTCRYYRQMPDIVVPETNNTPPWFPSQLYLLRRLTGEVMLLSGDQRAAMFLNGETQTKDGTFLGASALLKAYLKNKDDSQVVKTASLDRRRFGTNYNRLPNTKTIGW
ncbi:MAG: hypothetical protein KGI08_09510 [Thaumarchaeota archaeon]|nr:hypothetical protein [Nitrososphaerota archaeon]